MICTGTIMFNTNNKRITTFFLASLLTACGSDSDKTETTRVPTIPADFGAENNLAILEGTWRQDCSSISGNLAKRQQIEFGQSSVTLTVLDYDDASCSATNLRTRNIFIGSYQLLPVTQLPNTNNDVTPFEVIYTQSLSTAFTEGEVKQRNNASSCDKEDWQSGIEVDVSDWKVCFPLFDIPSRQHIRFVRIEGIADNSPRLFLDNQLEGYQPNGYPKKMDISYFTRGDL